jgi:hypothetical protein
VTTPYPLFERVRLLVAGHGGETLEEEFGAAVSILARFPAEKLPPFQAALLELSNGALTAEILESDEATIMPLSPSDD